MLLAHANALSAPCFEAKKIRTYSMPEVDVTTANTGALDIEKNLSWLQVSTSLHFLQTRFRLRDPKIVRGVRVNTNVRLG